MTCFGVRFAACLRLRSGAPDKRSIDGDIRCDMDLRGACSVDGKQYVVVPTGWGGWMKGFSPELYGSTRGSALFVFSLP